MLGHTSDVDKLLGEIRSKLTEQISEANKETIDRLTNENAELKKANIKLSKTTEAASAADKNFELFNFLMNRLKKNIESTADKEVKNKLVYNFLDCFFPIDFNENTYEAPLWLGCAVEYYSNRAEVFKILRALDIKLPEGIENFRLPQDWTEEELDAVFENMPRHANCNGCAFENNLRFWKPNALDDPIKICEGSNYTEIPWQFLLRNPLLKKEKYLTEIGRMFCVPKGKYHAYQWLYFAKITKYQELTAEEIKMIINNIDYAYYYNKDDGLKKFLLDNIELIEDEAFLSIIYKYNFDSYDFKYKDTLMKMPYKFIKQYMRDKEDLEWLKKHREKFTKEQITELTLAALSE